jgi:hypothetical protein
MESQVLAQRDFSAGQLNDTALRSDDTQLQRAGCRTARNVRILSSRGLKRRPGRRAIAVTTGICEVVRPRAGADWYMMFEPGRCRFLRFDFSSTISFTGMPWTLADIENLRWVEDGGTVIVGAAGFRPRVFTYSESTGSWEQSVFAFALDPNGSRRCPFYNFRLGTGFTLLPSARTGLVNVLFSGPVLLPGHVGVRFRYADRQLEIVSVTSSTTGTANVIEELPPTYDVTVDQTNGLQVGDVIEGLTSGTKGQVASLVSATVFRVLVTKNWQGFSASEFIIGPRSRMTFTSQATAPMAATTLWDEELMSDLRGWPGAVSKDQRRIVFCKFPQAGPAIVWSSTGTLNDFKVGAQKEDAIFEFVPENCTVLDVIGGADEFVFTTRGTYYIPISTANPLIAGSVEFRSISDDACSDIKPRQTTDGLVFVNASKTRVFGLIGTGQSARPYIIEDLTENSTDLLRTPSTMAVTSSDVAAPERYVYCANADGTLAVARYQRQQQGRGWVGWVPWDGIGQVKWIASDGPFVVATVEYTRANGAKTRLVEVFDDNELLDGSRALLSLSARVTLNLSSGVVFKFSDGLPFELVGQYYLIDFAGLPVSCEQNGWYRGDFIVNANGSLPSDVPLTGDAEFNAGFNFTVEVEPFLQHGEPGQSVKQRMRKRRIKHLGATFLRTQAVKIDGRLVPFYRAGENEEVAPVVRSETYRARKLGRDFDPRWSIRQELPGAFTLVELTTDITL